ncbi:helix-turn-helix domain-containing protein [Brevundimonas sp.]|uniref:helix-turn-helix domain-containing protein n=1 Tax=Brevundimonas sp. TaxID=1871086 RepID=UPI0037831CA3
MARDLDVSETRIQDYEAGERIPASRLWQFCGCYGVEVESLFAGLSHKVGGPTTPADAGRATELAEDGAGFDNPLAEEIVRAIGAAAADLNPVERRLALAALRGMGSRKLKTP